MYYFQNVLHLHKTFEISLIFINFISEEFCKIFKIFVRILY